MAKILDRAFEPPKTTNRWSEKQKTRPEARLCLVTGGEGVLRIQTQPTPKKRLLFRKSLKILGVDSSQLQQVPIKSSANWRVNRWVE
jgi:hypothetical protein